MNETLLVEKSIDYKQMIEQGGFQAATDILKSMGVNQALSMPLEKWIILDKENWASTPEGYFNKDVAYYMRQLEKDTSELPEPREVMQKGLEDVQEILNDLKRKDSTKARKILKERQKKALEMAESFLKEIEASDDTVIREFHGRAVICDTAIYLETRKMLGMLPESEETK